MGVLLDLIEMGRQRRRALVAQLRAESFTPRHYPLGEAEKPPTPLFGAEMGGFGEDWAFKKAPPPAPQGAVIPGVAKPIMNRSGSTIDIHPANVSRPYEDPNISRSFKRTSESTDQPVNAVKRSSGGSWDGIVRNVSRRSGFESSRGLREPTPSDRHAADLKTWNFDFSQ